MDDEQLKDELDAGELMGESLLEQVFSEFGEHPDMAALEQWIKDHPKAQQLLDELMDPAQRGAMLDESQRLGQPMPAELQRLLSAITPVPILQPANAKLALRKIIYYLSGAAAAVVIAVVGILLFRQSNKTNQSQPVVTAAVRDIAPGGNRATLTLSNGQTIPLDSAGTGLLAHQGAVHILKSGQGQVDYQPTTSPAGEIAYNTMSTPRGGTFKLTLSDGTRVWMNAGSTLRYPVSFTGLKERNIELSGEAYFEVAANKSVPFTVTAGHETIKILGTHFNVMAYADEKQIETTLLEGAVFVGQTGDADNGKLLHPGQQAQVAPDGKLSVATVDVADYTAWKDGLIQLNHADIPAVMRQISRWYDVQVVYQGTTKLPTWTLAGRISRNLNLSQVLQTLELNGIHSKLDGRTITVIL